MDTPQVSRDAQLAAVLEGVRRVGSDAARRADEIDESGSLPPDLFDDLMATGFFESLLPKAFGGYGFPLAQFNEMVIEGARANGSLGWIMMIGGSAPFVLGMFPEECVAKVLADHPRPRIRAAIAPKGVAVPTEGGYTVSGQWPFASGGPAPDVVAVNCVVLDGGAPRIGPSGIPDTVVALIPAAEVQFLDTWHVVGLKGTDSCDVTAREVFVAEGMTTNVFSAVNCFDSPLSHLPLRVTLATGHASVALGIAKGALEDIAELAKTKHAAMNPTARLADDPVFRHTLGEQALRHAAMKAFLDQVSESEWEAGLSGRTLSPAETLIGRTMAGFITAECVKIVDAAYTAAGSTSLYEESSLQRRLRDVHVATQHVAATGEGYRTLGAALVGEEMSPMDLF